MGFWVKKRTIFYIFSPISAPFSFNSLFLVLLLWLHACVVYFEIVRNFSWSELMMIQFNSILFHWQHSLFGTRAKLRINSETRNVNQNYSIAGGKGFVVTEIVKPPPQSPPAKLIDWYTPANYYHHYPVNATAIKSVDRREINGQTETTHCIREQYI